MEAALLTASVYVMRVREFALLGQGLLLIAHAVWLAPFCDGAIPPPWWNPLLMIAITLGLSHWWQRQKVVGGGATREHWSANDLRAGARRARLRLA